MTDVCADIRGVLSTAGFANVISGDEWPDKQSSPDALLVIGDPSPRPESTFSGGYSRHNVYFSVYCRDEKHGTARLTAISVRDALHELDPLPGAQWVSVTAEGQPWFNGREGDGLPVYQIPFMARVEE